ncbi:glucose dehydrogenase [FAD, quinone]-like [Euwallacea fornicatus]|uniref:glucose dehydrogenase [FAD, quinone]-like n=1 Tax=Euwallacea fornicatus TaxID=995702 RepID=UPI00338FB6B1
MFTAQCGNSSLSYGFSVGNTCNGGTTVLLFMSLVDSLLRDTCEVSDTQGRITPKKVPDSEYDFVVIGAGTAGSTIAGRLAEVKHWKILLLEAGDDEPVGSQVPSFFTNYMNSPINWNFSTEAEPVGCQGFEGKRCSWPRGKVLGGTGVINGMMFLRGTFNDYKRWVDAGNNGWSYDEILPDFKSYEDNRDSQLIDAKFHGTKGPVSIERYPYQPPMAWDILKAGEQIGYNISTDLNGFNFNGFGVPQMNSRGGVRLSMAKAFIRPQRNNPHLHVMLNTTATKIVIDQEKRASAVELIYNNTTYSVKVGKEVIICAGAVQTPQVLLLSGIGGKEMLESVGIKQVHDLPAVGKGVQNHVSFQLIYNLDTPKKDVLNMRSLYQYVHDQSGPMSSTGLAQTTARIHSKYSVPENPDIQLYFEGFTAKCSSGLSLDEQSNVTEQISIFPTYLHTKSRGYIGLHSKDPFAPPKIVANYLTHEQDVNGLIAGIRIVQNLVNTTILQYKYGLKLEKRSYGSCAELHRWDSDEFWACAVKFETGHENHQGSSCKMGLRSNPEACVDQRLQLHGINNIRIADASVFPDLPSANPQATIIMVAERGARFIKEDYLNRIDRK